MPLTPYRSMHTSSPTQPLLISMGCPVGIGPEIILRLFAQGDNHPPAAVVGDIRVLERAAQAIGVQAQLEPWRPDRELPTGCIPVVQVEGPDPRELHWGAPNAATGKAMVRCIERAVALLAEGRGAALVTCPISKFSLQAAGCDYPGHTEMLAALTGAQTVHMMMAGPRLRVVLVTIHEALRRIPALLHPEKIVACIRQTHHSLVQDFNCPAPRIAVAALNPHAGEQGLFGDEEARIIRPAIEAAGRELPQGEISGPWPPDTVFHKAAVQDAFDAVIALYHDQGLIPFKLLHFADGVNVSLGLPIVRTSVDHGTAYDIAGRGLARADSLAAALRLGQEMVRNRMRHARSAQ